MCMYNKHATIVHGLFFPSRAAAPPIKHNDHYYYYYYSSWILVFFPFFFTRTHTSFYPRLLNNMCTCVCRHHNDKPDRPEDLRAVSPRDVTERVIILMIIL